MLYLTHHIICYFQNMKKFSSAPLFIRASYKEKVDK